MVLYGEIRHHLRRILLEVRSGEVSDTPSSVKAACQMLIILGIDSRALYEEEFERRFLAQSAEFYKVYNSLIFQTVHIVNKIVSFLNQSEGQKYLGENSSSVYVKKVETLINVESEKAEQYLDESTVHRIVALLEKELIQKHMKTIVEVVCYNC